MHGWRKADHSQARYIRVLETAWMCHIRGAFYITSIAFGISARPFVAEGASVKLSHLVTGPLVVSRKAEAKNKQEYNVD